MKEYSCYSPYYDSSYIAALTFAGPYMYYPGEPIDFSPLWATLNDAVTSLRKVLYSAVKATAEFMSQVVLPVLKSVFTQCLKMLTSAISMFLCSMQKGLLFRAGVYPVAAAREMPMTALFGKRHYEIASSASVKHSPTAH